MLGTLQDKLIAGGLAAALAVSVGVNVKQAFAARDLRVQVSTLDGQINHPKTGYAVRLAACHANVTTLSGGIDRQNAAIAQSAAAQAQALAKAAALVAQAERRTAAAEQRAKAFLDYAPNGANVCERMLDLDRKLTESIR